MKHHLLRDRLLSVVLALLMLCSNVFYTVPTAVSAAGTDETSLKLSYYPYYAPFNELIELEDGNVNMLTCSMKNLSAFKPNEQDEPADYDFSATVTSGDSGPEEVTILKKKVVGYDNHVVALQIDQPKAGTYKVTATPKDDDGTTYTAEIKLMDVTFHAESGRFADETEQETYKTVAAAGTSLRSSIKIPKITPPDTKDFLGWSAQKDQTDYSNVIYTVPETGGDLYAAYGKEQRTSFEIKKDGEKIAPEGSGAVDFGKQDFGKTIAPIVLTVENTGTTKLKKITNSSTLNNFTVALSANELEPGASTELTITPKENLRIGTYEEKLNIDADRHFMFIDIKLTVGNQMEVHLIPAGMEKTYGETKTAIDIPNVEVKTPGGENADVSFEDLQVTLGSEGFSADAAAGRSYTYRIDSVGNPNYLVKLDDNAGKVKVNKATPTGNPEASGLHTGQKLSESQLHGTFTNTVNSDMQVNGTLRWENENDVAGDPGEERHRWVFTPENQTNYAVCSGETTVIVSPKKATTLIPNRANTGDTTFYEDYNKHPKSISFHTDREDHTGDSSITVEYAPENTEDWTPTAPVNAGTWKVRAQIPESGAYAAGLFEGFLIIRPREVEFSAWADSKVYDGTTKATVRVALSHIVGTDTVSAEAEGSFSTAAAENQKLVSVTLTKLVGKDAGNYAIPTSRYHVGAKILPREITLQPADISKTYGDLGTITPDMFTAENLVPGESLSELPLQLLCDGAPREANADTYPITAVLQQGNYTLKSDNAGTMTVNKATPTLREGISTSNGVKGGYLRDVTLTGEFINPKNHDLTVPGKLEWSNPDQVLPNTATAEVEWKFTMDQAYAKNYNTPDPAHGTVTVTLVDKNKKPIDIQGQSITETYNGKPHEYKAYEIAETDVDTSRISVEVLYQQIPDEYDRMLTYPDKWTNEPPVDAGVYAVQVTAKAGEYADRLADNTYQATLTITHATPTLQDIPVLTVPEGTMLKDIEIPGTPTGVDGQPLDGTYQWDIDQMTPVTKDGEIVRFGFFPNNPNYKLVYGSVTIKLAPDERTISAVIYNLPPHMGYNDYAVVDIAKSELKVGDTVVFYTDADATNPECDEYTISIDDIRTGKAVIELDDDALFDDDYVIYARISNSQKNAAHAVSYKPEIGFTVPDSFSLDAHEAVLTASCTDASYKTLLQSITCHLEASDFVQIGKEDTNALTITLHALSEGTTNLTVTMTFRHPDPERQNEQIVIAKNVLLHSTLHKHTGSLVPAKEATCTEPGMQSHYVCGCGMWFEDANCSRQIDNHESLQTPVKAHSWSKDYKPEHMDANKHYHVCTVCGKTDAGELHEWNVEAATEKDEKRCRICGYLAEAKLEHKHHGTLVPAKDATCTEPGNQKYYVCGCNMWFADEACTQLIENHELVVIPANGHTWSDGYMVEHADTDKHYHVCTVCGTKDEGALHEWNVEAATEETNKHCNICEYVVEPKLDHKHHGTLVPAKDATATEPGNKSYYVCDCGMWFSDETCTQLIEDHESVAIPPTGLPIRLGDVTMDGNITSADALQILRHAVHLITLDETQQTLADVTHDGNINSRDALEILRYAASLISSFD